MTKEDLKTKYGDDIVLLFKGSEPYTPDNHGNPLGVLIEKDGMIMCHECGMWLKELGSHIFHIHKMKTRDYKMKYGYNMNTGLCSRSCSHNRHLGQKKRNFVPTNPNLAEASRRGVEAQRILREQRQADSMQTRNKSPRGGTCPEQMKQRMALLVSKFSDNFSATVLHQADSQAYYALIKHYGNIVKARIELKLIAGKDMMKNDADLIYDLREYVKINGKLPFSKYNKKVTDFPHSVHGYVNRWGSMIRAFNHCGLTRHREPGERSFTYELIN